jgi:hypothetical protein
MEQLPIVANQRTSSSLILTPTALNNHGYPILPNPFLLLGFEGGETSGYSRHIKLRNMPNWLRFGPATL